LSKSLVSSDTLEFAKRLIHHGSDVSAAPILSLRNVKDNLSGVLNFLRDIEVRWDMSALVTRPMILELLTPLMNKSELRLATLRVWEAWMIPASSDSSEIRDEKAWKCYSHLFGRYRGCNMTLDKIWVNLNLVISRVRIVSTIQVITSNFKAINKCTNEYAD
jgi:hypothetical protein